MTEGCRGRRLRQGACREPRANRPASPRTTTMTRSERENAARRDARGARAGFGSRRWYGAFPRPLPRRPGSLPRRRGVAQRQVFGLVGGPSAPGVTRSVFLLAVASQPARYGPVHVTASFPLTAAGQPRIRTGFPVDSPLVLGANRRGEHNILRRGWCQQPDCHRMGVIV